MMIHKLITIILLVACLDSNNNSEKYVWATRLNVRNIPGINGEVVKQLNRGDKIKILEVTDLKFEVTDTLFVHSSKFDEKTSRYIKEKKAELKRFTGKWVKINSEDQIGYVFDFYLSRLNPSSILMKRENKIEDHLDSQLNYKKEEVVIGDDYYSRYTDISNDIQIEIGIKGKCGHYGISLKGISKLEGEMIGFYLFKNDVSNSCRYSVEDDTGTIKITHTCCC